MTRRWPPLNQPRSAGVGVVELLLLAAGSIMVVAVLGLIALALAPSARARDVGQWENSDPAVRQWYRSLMQPDNPHVSCCGESDAYWADEIVVEGDKVFAIITDTRDDAPLGRPHIPPGTKVLIPAHKYKWDAGNPTNHHILFLGPGLNVLCFVQSSGT